MKTKIFLSILALGLIVSAFGQKPTIELTFTAENNGQYVPLDSILIENLTLGGDTTLYAPDTVLVLDYVASIGDTEAIGKNSFSVSQNYPNPFKGKTEVNLYLPEKEHIKITVRDILGRELAQYENTLNRGNHSFAFYSGNEKYYLLTVTGKQTSKTIKMLNANNNTSYREKCRIVYNKYEDNVIGYKSQKAITGFVFNLGDELLMVGYSNLGESGMIDSPSTNQTYTFQFASNIPCPGVPTVTYEGQVYNTIQIFGQCWLKENLNVGTMINGTQNQTNNSTIEKYCYDNDPANCNTYGGLYQWDEMMQYTTTQGVQGICPPDWHLPTDEEWKILEGTVDSQYPVGDPEWDDYGLRGLDAGLNLKSTSGWYYGGNGTDLYSFTGLPGGYRIASGGSFYLLSVDGYFWSSDESGSNAWIRLLRYDSAQVSRTYGDKSCGFSVRCVQD
ncbi:MAG: T9SS type A sorting domain-containing protein [Bacteroidales bacterium]|nr:T9SS type A sorting domain-containing protein [Bacteroidales bacterium]